MLSALSFLIRYRKEIKAFLPIVQALLAMLRENQPRAKELQDRADTNPFKDLIDLAEETDLQTGDSALSPNDFARKMFKID